MKLKHHCKGFTLIEVIVVIVIASIMATLMFQFVRTSTLKSSDPIFSLGKSLKLQEIMENITLDYLENYTLDLLSLQTSIGNPEGSDQNNGYGSYRVIHNHFIKFVSNLEQEALPGEPEDGKLLKITIESPDSGERLTALFHNQTL